MPTDDAIWQTWYYLAQGNRGFIAWVEDWFDDKPGPDGLKATPKPWIAQAAPHFLEAGKKIGPLMSGAEWIDDGVAIYYSHPSIQLALDPGRRGPRQDLDQPQRGRRPGHQPARPARRGRTCSATRGCSSPTSTTPA